MLFRSSWLMFTVVVGGGGGDVVVLLVFVAVVPTILQWRVLVSNSLAPRVSSSPSHIPPTPPPSRVYICTYTFI